VVADNRSKLADFHKPFSFLPVMTETAVRFYGDLKAACAVDAVVSGPAAAARRFSVSVHFASYHSQKLVDASFHHGDWGGARHVKFDDRDQENFDVRSSVVLTQSLVLISAWCAVVAAHSAQRAAEQPLPRSA
jgi:hypothetical protein